MNEYFYKSHPNITHGIYFKRPELVEPYPCIGAIHNAHDAKRICRLLNEDEQLICKPFTKQSVTKIFELDGGSGYPQLEYQLCELMKEQFLLFCKKQKDYGPGNINAFGEYGILVRTNDKIERLKHLQKQFGYPDPQGSTPVNESIDDTWMDIATYALIALLVRKGQWPK